METTKIKTRLIVRSDEEFIPLTINNIAVIYVHEKITRVIDSGGKQYYSDKRLSDHHQFLDEKTFFRANRQHLVNINFIKGFRSHDKIKLKLELTIEAPLPEPIIISAELASQFKKWLAGE